MKTVINLTTGKIVQEEFENLPRQAVSPCTPIRPVPDGYVSVFLVGPCRTIIPAFTRNPEPREKAAFRDCCGQTTGR